MGKFKTYKRGLGAFISSEKGQRFFNFAYSIGAAIVIWGALFKILHLPGGNFLLSLGMGTEVFMFMLTAFDKPPREYKWEKVFPVFDTDNPDDRPDFKSGSGVVINGDFSGAVAGVAPVQGAQIAAPVLSANASPTEVMNQVTDATQLYLNRITEMTNELQRLHETTSALNQVSDVLLESYKAITENSANITESSRGYVAQMEDLNRNIGGLNTIYEIQLKSISSQLESIDRVNRGLKDIRDMYEKSAAESSRYCEETEKMARYMQQLNSVYEKMITAMTINMYGPNPMAAAAAAAQQPAAPQPAPTPVQTPPAGPDVPPAYQGPSHGRQV